MGHIIIEIFDDKVLNGINTRDTSRHYGMILKKA